MRMRFMPLVCAIATISTSWTAAGLYVQSGMSRRSLLDTLTSTAELIATTTTIPVNLLETNPNRVDYQRMPLAVPKSMWPIRDDGDLLQSPLLDLSTSIGRGRVATTAKLNPLPYNLFQPDASLYYPSFLFGDWHVTSTLLRKVTPSQLYPIDARAPVDLWTVLNDVAFGIVDPNHQLETCTEAEHVGHSCNYRLHFFSTLANTLQNQLTVNLGLGVPSSKIIADRAFNARGWYDAYSQSFPSKVVPIPILQQITWDYRNTPSKLLLQFDQRANDAAPFDTTHVEWVSLSRQSEYGSRVYEDDTFATDERSRVTFYHSAPKTGSLSLDVEVLCELHRVSENLVHAVCRVAVFGLTSATHNRYGDNLAAIDKKLIATECYYDYQLTMQRALEEFPSMDSSNTAAVSRRPCVTTPNNVVQCY